MLDISKITGFANKVAGKQIMVIKKHSPEILTAAGVVFFGATIVSACTATMKVDEIISEHESQIDKINSVSNNPEFADEYSDNDAIRDKAITYIQTGAKIGKNYLPTITLAGLSIACFLGAHNILAKRNVALLAAYKASEEAFNNYRDKVRTEYGEDKDREMLLGLEKTKVEEIVTDEKGKEKKVTKEVVKSNGQVVSQYARFFDETNPNWSKNPEQSLYFLLCVQNMLNDTLKARGEHGVVFLNEAYDALDMKRSTAGQFVGWSNNENGDGFIDFGIFDGDSQVKRDFVNGYERSILIDFNVDGVVYDLL